MIWLATISVLAGAVLAQRFKVVVLLPATAMVLAGVAGTAVVQVHTAWWSVAMAAAGISGMQLGYFIGLWLRFVLEAAASEAPPSFASSTHPARDPVPRGGS